MGAARQKLRESRQRYGFGVYVDSQPPWSGRESASLSPVCPESDPMVLEDMGPFQDHDDYMASTAFRTKHSRLGRFLHWNLMVPGMGWAIRRLRH